MTEPTDLAALAEMLERDALILDTLGRQYRVDAPEHADRLRTAARILRAVAAAPGPLRKPDRWYWEPKQSWFDALADAVGEPG